MATIVTVARRPLGVQDRRLRHVCADLRAPQARTALAGVDLCFHLGFQLWHGGGPGAMEEANVEGTANVVAAAPAALVFASSAAVYGAWPDNPLPITEDHPPRPNRECPYASHKLLAERRCLDGPPTVVLRLAAVLGPHADPVVRRAALRYRMAVPAIARVRQAVQFLSEGDAVEALLAAGRAACAGRTGEVCNAGPADWLDADGIASVCGGRVLALPRRVLVAGSEVGRRAGLLPFGADRAALLNGPLALDSGRAAEVLGWTATSGSAAVLAATVGRDQRGPRRGRLRRGGAPGQP